MAASLKLTPTWNLDPLPASDQTSLAYLLLDITQEGAQAAGDEFAIQNPKSKTQNPASAPLNLSLVLDTSGSMAGAKLQNLKSGVRWVINHLSPQDTIAITLFDDEVRPLTGSTPVANTQGLLERIDSIREAGGTAMSKGLLVGLDEAMKGRQPGIVSRIVVLTDGQTWGDADRCKQLAAQAGAAGIPITALGMGAEEDWSIELLDAMAMESGGDSGYIARPEEISPAFEGTVLAMQQTVARNLRLTVDPATGVSLRALYRVAPVISRLWPGQDASGVETFEGLNVETLEGSDSEPLDDSSRGVEGEKRSNVQTFKPSNVVVPLGDLQGSQTLLLEMVLPARKPGQYRLTRLALQYEVAGRDQAGSETAVDVVAEFAAGVQRGPGNPRVMNNVERATTFKLQTRALQASMIGDVATATRSLRAAATRLLNMGEAELAEAAESEAQLLETKGRMSAAGTKKLAFDTRRLAVSETEGINPATVRLDEELPVEG